MEHLVTDFVQNLDQYVPRELIVFLISMMPVLELRGGLIAASLLGLPIEIAIPLCVVGNIIPIPFVLLFIERIFAFLKRFRVFKRPVEWLENRAIKRTGRVERYEFWGLALFVGIPLPGTGAWTGSIIAAFLKIKFKKAVLAELLGIVIATVIMALISYGLIGNIIR